MEQIKKSHTMDSHTKFTNSHHRKRKLSSSSVSSVSSLTAIEEDTDDEADSEGDNDGQPAGYAPPYGCEKSRGCKAGSSTGSSLLTRKKKRMVSYEHGYDGQQSSVGVDSNSSDDSYGAVDDITDADDEELEVEKLEERQILESEDERQTEILPAVSEDPEIEDLVGLGPFDDFPTTSFLDELQIYSTLYGFGETDMTSEVVETSIQRRVHFVDSDSPDSDQTSTSIMDDELPGEFLQEDSLDPTLCRMIDNDTHRPRFNDIFGELDFSPTAKICHVAPDAVSDGSSGYESDDGETTDEDLPPPATITQPHSILRRDSTASLAVTGDAGSQRPAPRRRGPIMGTFITDPSKPVALVDCTGKHLVIIPAYASSRHHWLESATNSLCGTATNSPRVTTMHLVDESDTDAIASPTPLLSSSTNLMITALGNDATPGGQILGPPEAFYPSYTSTVDSSLAGEEDEDGDNETMLNVDDFIDFGNGSSDEVEKSSDEKDLGMIISTAQTVDMPNLNHESDTHHDSNAERFLNHLDRGIVSAFRRNDDRYQAWIQLPQHPNSTSQVSAFRNSLYSDSRTTIRKRKASNHMFAGDEAVRRKSLNAGQLPF